MGDELLADQHLEELPELVALLEIPDERREIVESPEGDLVAARVLWADPGRLVPEHNVSHHPHALAAQNLGGNQTDGEGEGIIYQRQFCEGVFRISLFIRTRATGYSNSLYYLKWRRVGIRRSIVVLDDGVLLGLLKVREEPDVLGMLEVQVNPRVKPRFVHILVSVDLR